MGNQPTLADYNPKEKSYAQITKSSSEENSPTSHERTYSQIIEKNNDPIKNVEKTELKLEKFTQEIHSHIVKEKTSIEQKLKNATNLLESYNADHKTAMEKIAVQEKQIDSITDIVEGFSTHFSNIGERQTKMEQQMLGQTKSLQNLTQTIESLTKFILGPTALIPESQNPTQSQYTPYTLI